MYPVYKDRGSRDKRRNRERTGILVGLDLFSVGGRLSIQDQWVHQPCHLIIVICSKIHRDSYSGKNGGDNMNVLDEWIDRWGSKRERGRAG